MGVFTGTAYVLCMHCIQNTHLSVALRGNIICELTWTTSVMTARRWSKVGIVSRSFFILEVMTSMVSISSKRSPGLR